MQDLLITSVQIDWSTIGKNSYLRTIPALSSLKEIAFDSPVTFFTGENGSGKSTLLEAIAIACGFNPEGGTKNYLFSTYDSHSELHEALRVIKGARPRRWGYFLRAESFYNVASREEEYAGLPGSHGYHKMSHGESFLATLDDNLRDDGLYILDEPEAALSPQRQLSLLSLVYAYSRKGAQFIIATHSPIILGLPDAAILEFSPDGSVSRISYEETDSYIVTKAFLNNKERMLAELLQDIG